MISFKEYLFEAENKAYKKKWLTLEKAEDLLYSECSDFMETCADTPIVRGMSSGAGDAYLVQGDTGRRASANTTNHYTVILDEFLPELGFPKRSKSLICTTWDNRQHTDHYGDEMFALIPYNDAKIGVCPYGDIFDTEIKLFGVTLTIDIWNDEFDHVGIPDTSFNMFLKSFMKKFTSQSNKEKHFSKLQGELADVDPATVYDAIKEAYTKPFKLVDSKGMKAISNQKHELWIGGKCVAIPIEDYLEIIKKKRS